MNGHPGRDTDVISRPSKSTIKDLSFYIGFTRVGSRRKDLGPCFGMKGHPGRDMDVSDIRTVQIYNRCAIRVHTF